MSVFRSRKVQLALGSILTILLTKFLPRAGFTPQEVTQLQAAIVVLVLAIIAAWTADKSARIKAGNDPADK